MNVLILMMLQVLRSSNPPLMVAKAVTFTSSLDENEEAELYSADNESTVNIPTC